MGQTAYKAGTKLKNTKTGQIVISKGIQDIGGGSMGQFFSNQFQPISTSKASPPASNVPSRAQNAPPTVVSPQTSNNGMLLGETQFKGLRSGDWKDLTNQEVEQNYLNRQGNDIYLKPGKLLTPQEIINQRPNNIDLSNKINEISSDELNQAISSPKTTQDILNKIEASIKDQNKYREGLLTNLQPTAQEIALRNDLADVADEIQKTKIAAQAGANVIEGKIEPMQFITGAQRELFKQANIKLNTLQAQETNLLNRLGLEQEIRQSNLDAIKAGLGFLESDLNLQFRVNDLINQEEEKVFNRNEQLRNDQRENLNTILGLTQGVSFEELSPGAQQKITAMALDLGIPMDAVINSMKVAKDKWLLEQSKKKSGGSSSAFKFNTSQRNALMGAGFSVDDIKNINQNLNDGFTIEQIINASQGLTDNQKRTLRNLFSNGNTPTIDQIMDSIYSGGFRKRVKQEDGTYKDVLDIDKIPIDLQAKVISQMQERNKAKAQPKKENIFSRLFNTIKNAVTKL